MLPSSTQRDAAIEHPKGCCHACCLANQLFTEAEAGSCVTRDAYAAPPRDIHPNPGHGAQMEPYRWLHLLAMVLAISLASHAAAQGEMFRKMARHTRASMPRMQSGAAGCLEPRHPSDAVRKERGGRAVIALRVRTVKGGRHGIAALRACT
eukprot:169791-Chlamydomonas_euryale.AAC.1